MNDDRNNDQKTSADHQRELDAFENAFNGHPVDAEFAELAELATVLATISPKIDSSFAAELDQRVKDHFPAEWTTREPNRRTLADRLRAKFSGRARSLMLPVTAGLAGVLIVGTVVATGLNQNGSDSGGLDNSGSSTNLDQGSADSASSSSSSAAGASALAPATGGLSPEAEVSVPTDDANDQSLQLTTKNPGKYAYGAKKRAVAHKTEIILGTSPENVQDVSNEITSVVDNHNGIVLDSNVNDGPTGVAGATFRLLIPTGGLDSAVAELSAVADLRSRSQEATDITAPTLTVQDRLQTSRAKVKSLVNELAETTTDEDRLAVEAELLTERSRVSSLTTKMNRLERRASLTPVRVDVQTGEGFSGSAEDGSWGPADAIGDIGSHLGTAAGVALIVLAIAFPLALLAMLLALINRIWVKSSRSRALEND